MKIFTCQNCGNTVHFNNDTCLNCGLKIGYMAELFTMSALEPEGDHMRALADPARPYVFCRNAGEAQF